MLREEKKDLHFLGTVGKPKKQQIEPKLFSSQAALLNSEATEAQYCDSRQHS